MGLACNLLTALGGRPDILALAPSYPARLPKDVHAGLEVAIAPLSKDVLLTKFMAIEEPTRMFAEDPDFVPSHTTLIGQFYDDLAAQLPSNATAYSTRDQVDLSNWFDGRPHIITGSEDAKAAIDLIKRQGRTSGTLRAGEPAHRARPLLPVRRDLPRSPSDAYRPFTYTGADIARCLPSARCGPRRPTCRRERPRHRLQRRVPAAPERLGHRWGHRPRGVPDVQAPRRGAARGRLRSGVPGGRRDAGSTGTRRSRRASGTGASSTSSTRPSAQCPSTGTAPSGGD